MSKSIIIQNDKLFVSIVMSCYNGSRWLHDSIQSVLSQTFENFEFIIVDDGSKDDSLAIVESYRISDLRIISIPKSNTGLADSLNVGIKCAKGKWIARLDADDLCEPTRLEEQVRYVNEHPTVVLLGSSFIEIDQQGAYLKLHRLPTHPLILVRHLQRLQRFFPHSSAFFRTDIANKLGGYSLRFRRAEDWRMWLDFSTQGQIACLPNELVRIRKHPDQISHDNNGTRQIYDGIAATVCFWLQQKNFPDPSTSLCLDDWNTFLNWLEVRIEGSSQSLKSQAWKEARTYYFSSTNRFVGLLRFSLSILRSGNFISLLSDKFFGSSLPEDLAKEWIRLSLVTHRK